ncbi:transcriptional regulator, RpiR family [Petrotoga mobilis SJ95]|uniref:Transcriptional regulator, RpiR family n=1 Tax=Petrotoga mobilis (strain DSM 10674 / SJ95) TaxID=403833 RepID=A9BH25_PETMO|nr:MurR/RpiR family transcriptional regulator [Petrotoga mobilis]ABX31255.1 transcriptional regulator, RpiR family [Petrotoga mobilis SJ95]HBT50751.1 MurR/RpiR family transcriptional regulator [Petrotoga sp.]
MSKIQAFLNSRMPTFTKSEKKVAEYILNSKKEDITRITITELATKCGTSEATIARFVKKAGFETFQDFKLTLALDNNEDIFEEEKDITIFKNDSPQEILRKVKLGSLKSIESTTSILDINNFLQAANFIRSAKRIEIYGVGSSSAVAKILQYKLTRLGFPSYALEDPHMQAISAATLNFGDLAIGISQSGSTKDTVDSLNVAKKHGATTISLTEHANSPITKYSDVVLEIFSGENPVKTSAGRSILVQIFAVEILSGLLYSIEYEKALTTGKDTARAVVNKLY